jgi:hypothetical protein
MTRDSELAQSLEDVRAAYRLLHAYQRRTLDTVNLIADQFPDRTFYQWASALYAMPPQRGKSPFMRGAWDFMPLYNTSFLFTKGGDSAFRPRKGDWLLEVKVETDSGHAPFIGMDHEPTLADLGDVSEAETSASIIVWHCDRDVTGNVNWYDGVWSIESWPTDEEIADKRPGSAADGSIRTFKVDTPLENLPDRASIMRFTDDAKLIFSSVLAMDFG